MTLAPSSKFLPLQFALANNFCLRLRQIRARLARGRCAPTHHGWILTFGALFPLSKLGFSPKCQGKKYLRLVQLRGKNLRFGRLSTCADGQVPAEPELGTHLPQAKRAPGSWFRPSGRSLHSNQEVAGPISGHQGGRGLRDTVVQPYCFVPYSFIEPIAEQLL